MEAFRVQFGMIWDYMPVFEEIRKGSSPVFSVNISAQVDF